MSKNNITQNLTNISQEGLDWPSIQKDMKSKLGNVNETVRQLTKNLNVHKKRSANLKI